jgi:hypothetical protein
VDCQETDCDPEAFHRSMNVFRHHLSVGRYSTTAVKRMIEA